MILKFQGIYQKNNSKQTHGSHRRFTKWIIRIILLVKIDIML